jgi:hypothetical protein
VHEEKNCLLAKTSQTTMMTNDKDRAIIDDLLLPNPMLLLETMTEE